MSNRKKILAISGSTRKHSTNLNLIKGIADLTHDQLEIKIYDELSNLPHFNPDHDTDDVNSSVTHFRKLLKDADGVIICTPEYAMGLPGTLKNALDWTVSSSDFSHKPVMAITASSMGEKAHQSLLATLNIIEAKVNDHQLVISFAKTKINNENKITDPPTLASIKTVIAKFIESLS